MIDQVECIELTVQDRRTDRNVNINSFHSKSFISITSNHKSSLSNHSVLNMQKSSDTNQINTNQVNSKNQQNKMTFVVLYWSQSKQPLITSQLYPK